MVTRVEYFNGTTSLGVSVQSPFTLTLNNLAAGTYQISAKVTTTDSANPVLQSAPLSVTIGTAPGAATAYFIHTDQLNTPRAITDGSGNLVWQWDSDPFGKEGANEQPAGQPTFTFNQRFPGQQFDRESNLHYNYFRDYDPSLGRYIQSDPIGLEGGINTYGYVDGSPLEKVDPLGLQYTDERKGIRIPCPPGGCIGIPQNAIDATSGVPYGAVIDEDRGRGRESASSARSREDTRECPPDKDECEKQWREARAMCVVYMSEEAKQRAGRGSKISVSGITGKYSNVEECARGLVSQECGGNKRDYGKKSKKRRYL
jgi:RHS repeat-associated protein